MGKLCLNSYICSECSLLMFVSASKIHWQYETQSRKRKIYCYGVTQYSHVLIISKSTLFYSQIVVAFFQQFFVFTCLYAMHSKQINVRKLKLFVVYFKFEYGNCWSRLGSEYSVFDARALLTKLCVLCRCELSIFCFCKCNLFCNICEIAKIWIQH